MAHLIKHIIIDPSGRVVIAEAPAPELFDGAALCRLTHSLISSGTERSQIESAAAATAASRESLPLGYCAAGVVEQTQGDAGGLKPGDRVALYGGPYVSHSELVVVPRRLARRIPDGVPSSAAAFTGLAAIALHAFRLARVCLGDVCFVAGAGLIGNMAAQLARLAGCRVVASDMQAERLELLREAGIEGAPPGEVEDLIQSVSEGRGADAILLCVSVDSADPMEQAIRAIRPGGRIVIVGKLHVHVPRMALFYKEAEITMSRAAGPGRYDPAYERDGIDYPVQFARWTEERNLDECLRLIAEGRLRVEPLIGGVYPVARVEEAYDRVLSGIGGPACILDWSDMK